MHNPLNHYEPQTIIRLKALRTRLGGVSEAWIWRREKAGDFPKRIKLGPRCVGWRLADIEAWEAKLSPEDPS